MTRKASALARAAFAASLACAACGATACGVILGADDDAPAAPDASGPDAVTSSDGAAGDGAVSDARADVADGGGGDDAADGGTRTFLVFASRDLTAGDMRFGGGGISGRTAADAHCVSEAMAAGRTGTFRAWLSLQSEGAFAFLPADARWVRPATGDVVFASRGAVASGPAIPISFDAFGAPLDADAGVTVWTGTENNGMPDNSQNKCMDWSSAGGGSGVDAFFGNMTTTTRWSKETLSNCDALRRIYCFQVN